MKYRIKSQYVDMTDADLRTARYADGSLALIASATDEDGFPDQETLSINLGVYGLTPPPGCVYVKDYSEHEGLPQALVEAGVGTIENAVTFGPFNASAALFRLNEDVLS